MLSRAVKALGPISLIDKLYKTQNLPVKSFRQLNLLLLYVRIENDRILSVLLPHRSCGHINFQSSLILFNQLKTIYQERSWPPSILPVKRHVSI